MSVRARVANWPLAWKAPLLAAGLLIGVAFVISQLLLNRLESDCPSSDDLRHIACFQKGGSGSSVTEIMRHAVDAASDGLRLSGV